MFGSFAVVGDCILTSCAVSSERRIVFGLALVAG